MGGECDSLEELLVTVGELVRRKKEKVGEFGV